MSPGSAMGRIDVILAAAVATVMIAHQVAAKAARDSLFLTYFDVTRLPLMMIAGAVGSAAAVLVMGRVLARHGPARLIPPIYGLSGLLFVAEWTAMAWQPALVAILLYLHIAVLGSIVISGFWSILNERYDPYQAKRVIARMAAAASLGGLLGGVAASAVAAFADARAILLMLAGMHLFCAAALGVVARGEPARPVQGAAAPGLILEPLKRNRLIRGMALLVLLISTNAALLDYLLKSAAAAELEGEALVHFFSTFYMAIGLGSFLLQTFAGERALRRLGLGGTIAVLPVLVLAGGLFAFVLRHLMVIAVWRAGAAMLNSSFFRAGFESLYTPIPPADKRASKLLIDVGADRSGDLLGSLLIMGILLLPSVAEGLLIGATALLAGLALLLILALQRGYVGQLASNLRDGTLQADEIRAVDGTTRRTIALTQTVVKRDELLREIAVNGARNPAADAARRETGSALTPPPVADPVVAAIQDLRSGEHERIARVLVGQRLTAELLPHAIPLLAREDVLQDLFRALRPVASSAAGQLVDALLDRRRDPLVRRRLPLVLGRADNLRAVQGLVECLGDAEADVRWRCAQALRRIRLNHPQLAFPTDELWVAARRVIEDLQQRQGVPAQDDEALRHLFTLLGLVYSPETLDLCYVSLREGTPAMRGTALEYLENLLSQDVREALWPVIGAETQPGRARRPLQDVARDLLKTAASLGKAAPAAASSATVGEGDQG